MKRHSIEKLHINKTKLERFKRHNIPKKRKFGKSLAVCTRCGGLRRHINKYKLNICGRCFREVAQYLGFRKLR